MRTVRVTENTRTKKLRPSILVADRCVADQGTKSIALYTAMRFASTFIARLGVFSSSFRASLRCLKAHPRT